MKARRHNSTLAIGGVSSPLDSFEVAESSVLRTNFCAEKPAHRQSAKLTCHFTETPYRKKYLSLFRLYANTNQKYLCKTNNKKDNVFKIQKIA